MPLDAAEAGAAGPLPDSAPLPPILLPACDPKREAPAIANEDGWTAATLALPLALPLDAEDEEADADAEPLVAVAAVAP